LMMYQTNLTWSESVLTEITLRNETLNCILIGL